MRNQFILATMLITLAFAGCVSDTTPANEAEEEKIEDKQFNVVELGNCVEGSSAYPVTGDLGLPSGMESVPFPGYPGASTMVIFNLYCEDAASAEGSLDEFASFDLIFPVTVDDNYAVEGIDNYAVFMVGVQRESVVLDAWRDFGFEDLILPGVASTSRLIGTPVTETFRAYATPDEFPGETISVNIQAGGQEAELGAGNGLVFGLDEDREVAAEVVFEFTSYLSTTDGVAKMVYEGVDPGLVLANVGMAADGTGFGTVNREVGVRFVALENWEPSEEDGGEATAAHSVARGLSIFS